MRKRFCILTDGYGIATDSRTLLCVQRKIALLCMEKNVYETDQASPKHLVSAKIASNPQKQGMQNTVGDQNAMNNYDATDKISLLTS
ncbi:hypothetical protein [Enterobacter ludwigii]